MTTPTPPPVPLAPLRVNGSRRKLFLILLLLIGSLPILLRLAGLLCPYKIPTSAMTPAMSPGDHFFMEGITYLFRKPHRGEILVFKTEGLDVPDKNSIFIKRLAGLLGERLRLADGKLFVNDAPVVLRNATGEIDYTNSWGRTPYLASSNDVVTVPAGHYFVLGDNSGNSMDSRYWGFLPAKSIKGRAFFRYAPSDRIGFPE